FIRDVHKKLRPIVSKLARESGIGNLITDGDAESRLPQGKNGGSRPWGELARLLRAVCVEGRQSKRTKLSKRQQMDFIVRVNNGCARGDQVGSIVVAAVPLRGFHSWRSHKQRGAKATG